MDVNDGKEWRSLIIYKFIDASSAASRKVKLTRATVKNWQATAANQFLRSATIIYRYGGRGGASWINIIIESSCQASFRQEFSFLGDISFGRIHYLFV